MFKFVEKCRNKKGFTLMEMLIVVAIIAILVAIAIPVFSAQMDKAKLSADKANIRAAYAEAAATALSSTSSASASAGTMQTSGSMTLSGVSLSWTADKAYKVTVTTSGVPSIAAE